MIVTLAKRAANRCSNPDCYAITSGPTDNPSGSVNIGEAAHIRGASPGSNRYRTDMTSEERSDITNGIWLCANCHTLIDGDENKYPEGLLFEWQRSHAQRIADELGKPGASIRRRYEERHLEEFGRLSYLAERIIIEKSDFWEYLLFAEVLRYEMAPVLRRWNELKRGLYMKPTVRISKPEFSAWMGNRFSEITAIAHAFTELVNVEFAKAWGAPGVAGSDIEIVATSRLFREMCQSALDWEEIVKFTAVDAIFDEARTLFAGIAGGLIEEAAKVPAFLSETFGVAEPRGKFSLDLTFELPEGWNDEFTAALELAAELYRAELED